MPLSATPEPRARPRAALAVAAALLLAALVLCSSALVPASASSLRGPARAVLEEAGAVQLHALRDPAPPGAAGAPGHGAQLLVAQVVFRHGARTPLNAAFYPDVDWECDESYAGATLDIQNSADGPPPPVVDPAPPPLKGGCRQGTLTQRGYGMALKLGAELRRRYVDELGLLPGSYRPGSVYAHTTSYRRTIATLRGVLTGLFPDGPSRFTANATDEEHSYFYPSNRSCGALGPVISKLTARADQKEASDPQIPAEAAAVRAALGLPDDGAPLKWWRLRDVLACMLAERPDERPRGLDNQTWELIQRRATEYETSIYAPGPWNCPAGDAAPCRDVLRLSIGPLLRRLLENMERLAAACSQASSPQEVTQAAGSAETSGVSSGGGDRGGGGGSSDGSNSSSSSGSSGGSSSSKGDVKEGGGGGGGGAPVLYLYSAHDTTVMPLLSALGVEERAWPPFTAHVELQLWQGAGGGRPWVRVLYGGAPLPLPPAPRAGSGGAAAGGDGGADQQHWQRHWRRAEQEQPEQQREEERGSAPPDWARGGRQGGWVALDDLSRRLSQLAVSDSERDEACWPARARGA